MFDPNCSDACKWVCAFFEVIDRTWSDAEQARLTRLAENWSVM